MLRSHVRGEDGMAEKVVQHLRVLAPQRVELVHLLRITFLQILNIHYLQ